MTRRRWWLLAPVLVAAGCGVVSREVRREAVAIRGLAEVQGDPEAFAGRTVILGGELIETRNRPDGTTLVVLEKRLGLGEQPRPDDVSGGRFMVRFGTYLDPALFARGRRVTVAGAVQGVVVEPVGEAPYPYVVLAGREVHLWRDPPDPPYPNWPAWDPWSPLWHDSRWGRRPWWW